MSDVDLAETLSRVGLPAYGRPESGNQRSKQGSNAEANMGAICRLRAPTRPKSTKNCAIYSPYFQLFTDKSLVIYRDFKACFSRIA
jgi:hypothetical protein